MKKYEHPEMEVEVIEVMDTITTSCTVDCSEDCTNKTAWG